MRIRNALCAAVGIAAVAGAVPVATAHADTVSADSYDDCPVGWFTTDRSYQLSILLDFPTET